MRHIFINKNHQHVKSQRDDARDPRRRRRQRRFYRDDKGPFILEIDDETDVDIMSVLLEEQLPEGIGLQLANA